MTANGIFWRSVPLRCVDANTRFRRTARMQREALE